MPVTDAWQVYLIIFALACLVTAFIILILFVYWLTK